MADSKMSEKEMTNTIMFNRLTTEVGSQAVRIYFDRIVPPTNLAAFLQSNKQRFIEEKELSISHIEQLFSTAGSVTSTKFDIPLMMYLIRCILKVEPPTLGWNVIPYPIDYTEEADIARLKCYSKLSFCPESYQMSNADFDRAFTDVRNAISRLSNKSLDAEVEKILNKSSILSQDLKSLQLESKRLKEDRDDVVSRHLSLYPMEKLGHGSLTSTADFKGRCDDENRLVRINERLSFYPLDKLGQGSHGTVFKGRFGRIRPRPVAVKLVDCLNEHEAKETHTEKENIYKKIREIETMETLNMPSSCANILHFIDSFVDKKKLYLAFELAKGTLHDYVDDSNVSWRRELSSCDVVRGVVNGLRYTHKQKIVHRDLKPANIFIVEHSELGLKAVIGDFGSAKATNGSMFLLSGKIGSLGYIAPEIWTVMKKTTESFGSQCSKQSDIFSLALVIYFTLSLGKHPYGNEMKAQSEIENASLPNCEQISSHINSFAYMHMLRPMLNNNPTVRPMIEDISEHPALMSANKVMEFFVNKSNEFENLIRTDPSRANILEDSSIVTGIDWMNRLPVNMQTYLRSYKLNSRALPLYNGKTKKVRFLLRAVRNTKVHHNDYPQSAKAELGHFPEGHIALWLTVCPKLLMHVYDKLGPP